MFWSWEWRFDVSAVLLSAGLVYNLGWTHLRRRRHFRLAERRRLLAFLAGLAVVAIALMSPIDTLQEVLFWVHMLQHMLLMYLAAPLLLAAFSLPFGLWGVPPRARRAIGALLVAGSIVRRGLAFLTRPGVARVVSTGILWVWHIPALYDAALANEMVHDVEHISFFGAYLLFWWPLIGSPPQRPQLRSNGARALHLTVGAAQSALLGGLIAFFPHVLYTHYLSVPRVSSLSALADQQLGGALMWFSGPLIYGLAAALSMQEE